ncbi:MAG TPA: heavy-metal-associated domain-containing protein [Ferruginibacter sp.]|nr:heavy-metal-associated domain-containing protein [Ferruginibacter sp.]HMX36469.1 heavy-metal-associated domain-containing protein [Ferruginibacter sp.]HNF03161.1 heavy-metal-associated domain-containing protein [Ferruginibacter sp.]HNF44640.1 heavy-metal-associated domain-containing protein [Ferruginibacter sp.]HNG63480.1 heavy-metal-associated domain-containing protein [Ferruginibacter sp.]
MKTHTLLISGMNGEHCVRVITKVISDQPGTRIDHIEVGRAEIGIDETRNTRDNIVTAIEKLGYKVAR